MTQVSLREVLPELGFEEDWTQIADRQPGYSRDFNQVKIRAVEIMSRYFQPVFSFWGTEVTSRSMGEISFEVPVEVESFEHAVAWITFCLDRSFQPLLESPSWLSQGREWADCLPWMQRQREYETRPQCRVEREWMRIAARRIGKALNGSNAGARVSISFDGSVLRIGSPGLEIALTATGPAWPAHYSVMLDDIHKLTRRLMQSEIEIGIWDGKLQVGRRSIPLA